MSVAVAVSGGMDSLYTLLVLYERAGASAVFAVHARLRPHPDREVEKLLETFCHDLGITFHLLDLRDQFKELVIRPFADAYARGETPNPCARCNRWVKFGLILDHARKLGAESVVTGHYAVLEKHAEYGPALRRGVDSTKDQSYFLALTPVDRLAGALFPLGALCKHQVREELEKRNIAVPVPRESQEICFIPNDYRVFLQETGVRLPGGGPMIFGEGLVVGHHQGLWQYTEGQRRGLGVAWSEPLYVIGKDRSRNALLLGTAAELEAGSCVASDINLLVPIDRWPNELFVQTRYRQNAVPADVLIQGKAASARMLIRFHTPQLPPAPGQVAAIFDADGYVLAGGVICKSR